jgi:hypothetical protein
MSYHIDDQAAGRRLGPVGTTLLILTVIGSLFLLYHSVWFAVIMVELAHDVPSPWTVSDFSLIALPVSILAIALAAIFALVRRRLMPIWICLAVFLFDFIVVITTFE